MQTIDSQTNDRCFGCGDFAAFCDSADCSETLQRHSADDHRTCDILACSEASLDSLDPFTAPSPMNVTYIPDHKRGVNREG